MNEKILERVKNFVDMEEHSCSPVVITPENVAKLCGITVEDAEKILSQEKSHLCNEF